MSDRCVYPSLLARRAVRSSVRRGVTLLEVVLSLGILCAVTSLTYWFYASSLDASRTETAAADKLRLARVVLDRIATEIRQATVITTDNRVGIRGEAERIWLSSYRVPTRAQSEERKFREEAPEAEYDLTTVDYHIVRHPDILHPDGYEFPLGLARVEQRIPRPDVAAAQEALQGQDTNAGEEGEETQVPTDGEEGEGTQPPTDGEEGEEAQPPAGEDESSGEMSDRSLQSEEELAAEAEAGDADLGPDIRWDELYAPEIRYLRFCYFDGSKWWDAWDIRGESPLPQLVMVTIGFEPRPPFGAELGLEDKVNDEFCECILDEALECVPLAADQYSTVVRVPQADPLFRSRVSRETQSLIEELTREQEQEAEEGR